jgi:hypothetical protein
MDPEKRIAFLEDVVKFQQRHHQELEDGFEKRAQKYRESVQGWRYLALQAALTKNPWAKLWKYMAKYWRNSYKMERRAHKSMEDLYIRTLEGVAKKLERIADRQGPGGLCETLHERDLLKMLAEEIRGGRWQ